MPNGFNADNLTEEEFKKLVKEFAERSPFYSTLGIKVLEMKDGTAKLAIEDIEPLRTPNIYVHGGAIASLADSAMAIAILSLNKKPRGFATIDMNVSYFSTVQKGPLVAEARILKNGKRVIFGESEVLDGNEKLVAKVSLTFIYTDVD